MGKKSEDWKLLISTFKDMIFFTGTLKIKIKKNKNNGTQWNIIKVLNNCEICVLSHSILILSRIETVYECLYPLSHRSCK